MRSTTRTRGRWWLPALLLCFSGCLFLVCVANKEDAGRSVEVRNQSGQYLEVYWIHPKTQEMRPVSTPRVVVHGGSFRIHSFVGHLFQVRQVGDVNGGECTDYSSTLSSSSSSTTCRIANFDIGTEKDQVVVIERGFFLRQTDHASLSKVDSVSDCQLQALKRVATTKDSNNDDDSAPTISLDQAEETVEALARCIEKNVSHRWEESQEQVAFLAQVRTEMAARLENYTCADPKMTSSSPKEIRQWIRRGVSRTVHVLLERPASRVHVIDNFITDEECRAMELAAEPLLRPATVSDGAGGRTISDERRALQADIRVPWHLEAEGNPIATVSRKVYDYINHVLDLDIEEWGQEDLMSIQYFGRNHERHRRRDGNATNEETTPPDQYMAHCDGHCNGLAFRPGNRVGTMVMYCSIPQLGGATHFGNAGLHVVPQKGTATFFSYIHPETQQMDKGFTKHSGCPVLQGEKKIVTQWIRWGVDKDNPWSSFNSLGVKISDDDDYYEEDDDEDDKEEDDGYDSK